MKVKLRQINTITVGKRGCGYRKKYAVYAVGGTERSSDGALAAFTLIDPPIPYQVRLHRTARIVDGNAILGRLDSDEWWVGASKRAQEKKAGDAWSIDHFGMTAHKRLNTGECGGAKSLDEATAIILGKIQYDNRIGYYFREITRGKIQEIKAVAADYSRLQEALHEFAETRAIGELFKAQACLWRIAYKLPPSRRAEYIPNIVRMLVLMGLTKDAAAMKRLFR